MIKIDLLLRRPSSGLSLDAGLRARLEQLGFVIDGNGRATVSAHMDDAAFAALFGPAPPLRSGFAPLTAPALAVPDSLQDDISLITCPPRHGPTSSTPRVHHASI